MKTGNANFDDFGILKAKFLQTASCGTYGDCTYDIRHQLITTDCFVKWIWKKPIKELPGPELKNVSLQQMDINFRFCFLRAVSRQVYTDASMPKIRKKMRRCLQRGGSIVQDGYDKKLRSFGMQYSSDELRYGPLISSALPHRVVTTECNLPCSCRWNFFICGKLTIPCLLERS